MTVEVLIRSGPGEQRVCLVKKGKLIRAAVHRDHASSLKGGIFLARVVEVNPGIDSAFIQVGLPDIGFLPAVKSQVFDRTRDKPKPISKLFYEGQMVLVQATNDARYGKGPKFTTNLQIENGGIILHPAASENTLSTKPLKQEINQNFQKLLADFPDESFGLVAKPRTANYPEAVLYHQTQCLIQEWMLIKESKERLSKPGLVRKPRDPVVTFLENTYQYDVSRVRVQGGKYIEKLNKLLEDSDPAISSLLEIHNTHDDIFEMYDLADQWEFMLSKEVKLPSGGSIIIEELDTLIAIDVNSGKKNSGINVEEVNLNTNLEAIEEIIHQVILRNLGGQIVIDILPQKSKQNFRKISSLFANFCSKDEGRSNFHGLSSLGLLEFTRSRVGYSISEQFLGRTHRFYLPEAIALEALYSLEREMLQNPGRSYSILAGPLIVNAFKKDGIRRAKANLEKDIFSPIDLKSDTTYNFPEYSIVQR